jgi:hypothetical protein
MTGGDWPLRQAALEFRPQVGLDDGDYQLLVMALRAARIGHRKMSETREFIKETLGSGDWAWPEYEAWAARFEAKGVWPASWAWAELSTRLAQGLAGFPILESEHLPQANSTAVILADLKSYALFERGELNIAFSEHAAFTSDKGTWRFSERLDGKPWLINAITLADPTGSYTVSPFVYLND